MVSRSSQHYCGDQQRNRVIAAAASRMLTLCGQVNGSDMQWVILLKHFAVPKALQEDLKRSLDSLKSEVQYKRHGHQYIVSKMQTHSVQRSNYVDDHEYYQNRSKSGFRALSKK
ncbi:hypothetical protein GBAR_LOCUS10256 [Geodia barretti]|uniref:VWA-Hint protein Vwaint domain-containing protein n=1 Tax=Geodia barretti TaxID=519541 RepID=A0AA35RUT7_GEOBA|nr:hypothetical protein GBAR_LOCUS10256 [Geodia barretti]